MARGMNQPRIARPSKRKQLPQLGVLLALVAGDVRRKILLLLLKEPLDVTTLAKRLRVDVPGVSHKLGQLRENGLVTVTKDSRRRIYSLGPAIDASQRGGETTLSLHSRDGSKVTLVLSK